MKNGIPLYFSHFQNYLLSLLMEFEVSPLRSCVVFVSVIPRYLIISITVIDPYLKFNRAMASLQVREKLIGSEGKD